MTPDVYTDTYKAYKKGTQRISKWLVENAASNQSRTHVTDPNATETGPTHNTAERAPLVPLAREVAKKEPPVSLPDWFLPLLKDVIRKRAECTRVFLSMESDNESIAKSNHAHEHFVGVLRKVFSILSKDENFSPERKCPVKRSDQPAEPESLADLNKFAGLVVDDLHDATDSNSGPPITPSKEDPGPASNESSICRSVKISTAELDQAEFEFACFSLAQDYFHVKEHLRGLWKSWVLKEISLVSASAITNIAIHSLRVTANAAWEIPHTESLELAIESMESVLSDLEHQHKPKHCFRVSDDSKCSSSSLVDICGLLRFYIEGHPENLDFDFREVYSVPDWKTALSIGAPLLEQIKYIIARTWPDIDILIQSWHELDEEHPIDEISRAVATVHDGGKLELWMILAIDVFVQLHYVLRHNISNAWEELKATAGAIQAQVEQHKHMLRTLRLGVHKNIVERMCSLEIFIYYAIGIDAAVRFRTEQPWLIKQNLTSFYAMKHHPVLCGTFQFHILRNAQVFGVAFSNEARSLTTTAHLYNATKKEGIFKGRWNDMETFMSFYTPQQIFQMETPSEAKQYLSALQISNGMRIADMTQATRDMKAELAMGLEDVAIMIQRDKRTRPPQGNLQTNTHLLEVLQARHCLNAKLGHALREAKHMLSLKSERGRQVQNVPRSLTNSSTTVEFLTAVCEGIKIEERQLWFNFLSLNWTCLTLFRQMRERLLKGPWKDELSKPECSDAHLYLVAQLSVGHIATGRYEGGICAAQLITALGPERQNRAQSYLSSGLNSDAKAHKR